jgi:hypothetical protein
MSRFFGLRTLLTLVASAALAFPAQAAAEPSTTVTHTQYSGLLFVGACLGSEQNPYVISFDVDVMFVAHFSAGGSAQSLFFVVRRERFEGVGLSDGVRYLGSLQTASIHRFEDDREHVTYVFTTRLISPGPAQNLIIHGLLRFIVDYTTGELVFQRDVTKIVCVPAS